MRTNKTTVEIDGENSTSTSRSPAATRVLV